MNYLDFRLKKVNTQISFDMSNVNLNLDITHPISSTPFVAVRPVMNNLLSQRSKELERINSQPKAPRGKRLKNNTGLNITDDEFLILTMKEYEQKNKNKKRTRSLEESGNGFGSNSTSNATRRRDRPAKQLFHMVILQLKLLITLSNRSST